MTQYQKLTYVPIHPGSLRSGFSSAGDTLGCLLPKPAPLALAHQAASQSFPDTQGTGRHSRLLSTSTSGIVIAYLQIHFPQ